MSLPGVRLPAPKSDLRAERRGSLAIAGVTRIDGAAAPCRVHLHDASDGSMVGYRRTGVAGTYEFQNLAPGKYYLVILDDRADTKRAKVEHVEL